MNPPIEELDLLARDLRREADVLDDTIRTLQRLFDDLALAGPVADAARLENDGRQRELRRIGGDLLEAVSRLRGLALRPLDGHSDA